METKSLGYEFIPNKSRVYQLDLKKYVDEMTKLGMCNELRHDYAVPCPYCWNAYKHDSSYHGQPYKKLKLWIDKGLEYSHCFRCGSVFLNDDDSLKIGVTRVEPPLDMNNWTICKLPDQGYWTLDRFNSFDNEDELGLDYLIKKRHYHMRKLYKLLNIKFYQHNPVIPFYYKGELIYYQIKLAFGDSKIPYFSPHIDHKPPYIIEHGNDLKKIIICEGVFDAIACLLMYPDRIPFAVLGSSITPYQIAILRSFVPEDILIYMDETSISNKIKYRIEEYIDYADINIVKSTGEDPEECLKRNILVSNDQNY